jgi:hypothetical protein
MISINDQTKKKDVLWSLVQKIFMALNKLVTSSARNFKAHWVRVSNPLYLFCYINEHWRQCSVQAWGVLIIYFSFLFMSFMLSIKLKLFVALNRWIFFSFWNFGLKYIK